MTDDRLKTGGAFDALPDSADGLVSRLRGRVLSGYRVGGVIGSGGMGYVLRASRAEGDFDREAAVKIVPASLGTSEMAERFRTEVRILARLNHPSIAQLYDAGQTEEGWPYLVMEYVDGRPIDEYCTVNDLDVDARVELLIRVARAVRFAHARLIVHRDLKPSNVLVDENGRPKLLDFGIAKLLEPGTPEHTVGHRPMTPQYASPEQLLGADITTGSDIYQLGILALAVIAEETPLESATLQEAIRNAAAGNDRKISERAARQVPKDLLAIITRCLHSDPEDRYTDVNALLRDLDSYRSGLPVSARKVTRLYRLKKLVQRNLPATAFALLAATIAIGSTIYYTIDVTKAKRLAEKRAETASRTLTALSAMIADTYSELIESRHERAPGQSANPQLQNEPLRLVLDRTEKLIDSVVSEDSVLRAELLYVQGMTNRELDRLETARDQLEEAIALMRDGGNEVGEIAVLHEIVKLEAMLENTGPAYERLREAIELLETTTVSPALHAKIFITGTTIASDLADNERSRDYANKAISILEALPDDPPIELADAYSALGLAHGRLEQPEPMRGWMRKAVALYIELEGPSYRGLSRAYNGLAWSYMMEGDYESALKYLQRELEVGRANFGTQHMREAIGQMNMGIIRRRLGQYDKAIEHMLEAKHIIDALPGEYVTRYAALHINLGNTYRDTGNVLAAARSFERGLEITSGENVPPRYRASLLNNYGDLLMLQGKLERAIDHLQLALVEKRKLYGADNISTARTMLLLVQAHIRNGSLSAVPDLLESAKDIYWDSYGAHDKKNSFVELVTGQFRLASGDLAGARKALVTAHEHRLEEYDAENILVLSPLFALVRTELADSNSAEARKWFEKTSDALAVLPESHPERIEAGVLEAELLYAEQKSTEAKETKRRVRDQIAEHLPDRLDWKARLAAIDPD